MVMEAATLNSPHRRSDVVPVQKSLSLPSYARAGGEGIDHRLIFAALEQKEKVRRKSKIFTREKSARQNIFCLPIPSSGAKCRETSLSSDTSCSSLEYQKPKPVAKQKKDDPKCAKQPEPLPNETAKTIQLEIPSNSYVVCNDTPTRSVNVDIVSSLKASNHCNKERRSPIDTLRLNVGSSDSMDRSSRSSSDSLSRKERLVAIKARVEAAREKYGESSSEDETRSSITRYNSDGVIHRSVREIKSKSSRSERRLRRRSQDEWAIKRANRKQNLSLYLSHEGEGIKLDLAKSLRNEDDVNHLDIKTDFCPSPNFPDLTKKNYFSDFPSKENAARFVQARIRHIEDEERKRRSGSDFREKIGLPSRQSPQHFDSLSPVPNERKHTFEKQNGSINNFPEKKSSNTDLSMRYSPVPRTSQAPTPPPRSPKSITFVNKAFIQHQNASILTNETSLDRKKFFQPDIPNVSYAKIFEDLNSKAEVNTNEVKYSSETIMTPSEKQKIRELISNRRKTCGNFDFIEKNMLNDLCQMGTSAISSKSILDANKNFSSEIQIKKTDNKGNFSHSEKPQLPSEEDGRGKMWKSKWHENDQRREYMFNSLESKKKSNLAPWVKWKNPPPKTETCLCRLFPNSKLTCICKSDQNSVVKSHINTNSPLTRSEHFIQTQFEDTGLYVQYPPNRLSKSEVNIVSKEQSKSLETNTTQRQTDLLNQSFAKDTDEKRNTKNDFIDKISATANLESAMEELESVYRSLKISSDNLSDRNSVSISLSEDESKLSKSKNDCLIANDNSSHFKRRSSICESNLKSNAPRMLWCEVNGSDESAIAKYPRSYVSSPLHNSAVLSNDVNSDANQLSIDELFNDLTQQLDFEQKLLREPRDNRSQQSKFPTNRFEKRSNNPTPQVSIRKEFFDNLCKGNFEQNKNQPVIHETSDRNILLGRKKYKAVRSLSENISYLMTTANSEKNVDETITVRNYEKENCSSKPSLIEHMTNGCERIAPDSSKTNLKRDLTFKQSNLSFGKADINAVQNSKLDEIRHIRVSMDSNASHLKPIIANSKKEPYHRLSSAVCSSQVLPKSEISKSCNQEMPSTSSNSKENLDVLDETGLEKLLNSLLGDVPERQQSSLLLSKGLNSPTPPPVTSGEMCVLQHLDVIRLKPVPS